MVYFGLIAGVVAGNVAAHAAGLDAFRVYAATLILIIPALIGAKLFYVAANWGMYRHNLRQIWNRNKGGAAQYGGLLFVLPASVPVLAALQLTFGAYWDAAIFTILVLMIFGRVGCLLNGCCAGRPSGSWAGMYLPNQQGVWERRIPNQCLEAAWAAVLLVCAIFLRHSFPFPGALFLFIMGAYPCGRLVLESTRELRPGAARFTIHHRISVAMILLSLAALAARWPR
jgi:phosphatidylglycerol---prolipoprotein diacylglyceryl transferase